MSFGVDLELVGVIPRIRGFNGQEMVKNVPRRVPRCWLALSQAPTTRELETGQRLGALDFDIEEVCLPWNAKALQFLESA